MLTFVHFLPSAVNPREPAETTRIFSITDLSPDVRPARDPVNGLMKPMLLMVPVGDRPPAL